MKRILLLILFIGVFLTGCINISTSKKINNKIDIDIDISNCNIITDNNSHGGFHGDGEYFVKADCSEDYENLIRQIKSWNELSLSNNLQLIMYGGEKDGVIYGHELAKNAGIPEIKNGYYYFVDRHSDSKDKHSDVNLFDRYSYNFTLALYDKDSNIFYYYEFDT